MTARHLTFNQILAREAPKNAQRLMTKARIANRVAKQVKGRGRARAYVVKHNALTSLLRRFPESVRIAFDPALPDFVVLMYGNEISGLHAPATELDSRRTQRCAA